MLDRALDEFLAELDDHDLWEADPHLVLSGDLVDLDLIERGVTVGVDDPLHDPEDGEQ